MLVIKIKSEKSKAVFQDVLRLLSDFDVHSASWEDEVEFTQTIKVDPPKSGGGTDFGALVDFALKNLGNTKRPQ